MAAAARPVPLRPYRWPEAAAGDRTFRLSQDVTGEPLRDNDTLGFEYSDCWVQDNRLVVLNARDALQRGADIRVRTACRAARRCGDGRD